MFTETIRTGNSSGSVRKLNRLMPFSNFGNMTDEDLKIHLRVSAKRKTRKALC